jgi:uncharacterized membrane protein YciS (DUF1049 family)
MSERAFLFLLSLAVFVGGIGVAAGLIVTNQVRTVDGLFLFCSSLAVAFAFGLYLRWMVRSAMHTERRVCYPHTAKRLVRGQTQNAEATSVLSNLR